MRSFVALSLILFLAVSHAASLDLTRLSPYISFHDRIIGKLKEKKFNGHWSLSRYDADLALEVGGEIGIFGIGKSAAFELIWEREDKKSAIDKDVELDVELPRGELSSEHILSALAPALELHRFSNRKILRLTKLIEQDTLIIQRFAKLLAQTPVVNGWAVTGFFKIYEFSSELDLISTVGAAYEKRVRIRFKVTPSGSVTKTFSETPQRLGQFLSQLSSLKSSRSLGSESFNLQRIWLRSDVVTGFDLGIFEKGVTKSLVIVAQKIGAVDQDDSRPGWLSWIPTELDLPRSVHEDFPLSQLRVRASGNVSTGLKIAELENETTLDLHYFRSRP